GSRAGDALRRNRTGEAAAAGGPGPPIRPRPPAPPPPPPSRNDRPLLGQEGQPRPSRDLRGEAPPARPQPPPIDMPDPPLPPANRGGAARRGADDTQAPGVRGFRDIAADTEDLGRAAAQANRAARRTYANVPSPSPEFDRVEPSLEDRGGDQDMPYSWDDTIEETERQVPALPPPPAPRARIGVDRDREPKRARAGTVFPFKSAIAIGVVLILVG